MTDISTAILVVGGIVWLGMGGWAFGRMFSQRPPQHTSEVGAMLLFCTALGPFMAGLALAWGGDDE